MLNIFNGYENYSQIRQNRKICFGQCKKLTSRKTPRSCPIRKDGF